MIEIAATPSDHVDYYNASFQISQKFCPDARCVSSLMAVLNGSIANSKFIAKKLDVDPALL